MVSEPSQADIEQFTTIIAVGPNESVRWLKAYDNNIERAMNAFFENPTALNAKETSDTWDESQFHSDKAESGQQGVSQAAFSVRPSDTLSPQLFNDAPSRPPSRIDDKAVRAVSEADQREKQDVEQAMALSVNETISGQDSGVTNVSEPYFGPATRDHNDWTMTLAGVREILPNPGPLDRKRQSSAPAFIKPLSVGNYLPSFITILHAIPMAREALLVRDYLLPDYGQDKDWWDGNPIKAPKIVEFPQTHNDTPGEDIIFEVQRLMAFLNQTDRAYGNAAVLDEMVAFREARDDFTVTSFLEAWRSAVSRLESNSSLSVIFESTGVKVVSDELKEASDFFCLDLNISNELADSGRTLYDVIDDTVWPDWDDTEQGDVYLEAIGDIFTFRVMRADENAPGLGIKIPATWYPDRYAERYKDQARDMLAEKLAIKKQIAKIESSAAKLTTLAEKFNGRRMIAADKLINVARVHLDLASRTGKPRISSITRATSYNDSLHQQTVPSALAEEITAMEERVKRKLELLDRMRSRAWARLRELSLSHTKALENQQVISDRTYTLRGVSTNSHITYVRQRTALEDEGNPLEPGPDSVDWQWWKIEYIANHAKPVTCSKVREIQVLKAAKDESRTALLVYASEHAVAYQPSILPRELQNFVHADNLSFADELLDAASPKRETSALEEPNWGGYQDLSEQKSSLIDGIDPTLPSYVPTTHSPPSMRPGLSEASVRIPNETTKSESPRPIIPNAAERIGSTSVATEKMLPVTMNAAGQEMQERRKISNFLQPRDIADRADHGHAAKSTDIDMNDDDSGDLKVRHVEFSLEKGVGK